MTDQVWGVPVDRYDVDVRATFMKRVYGHLVAGVAAFVAIEVVLFQSGAADAIADFVFGTSWLLILGGFMLVSWMASSMAVRSTTPAAQYGGYAALIVAEALIFVPMLWIANEPVSYTHLTLPTIYSV